jgi:hypothetical protein
MDPAWAVVTGSAVAALTVLIGGVVERRWQSKRDRGAEQAGAVSTLLGAAQLLGLQCSWFAAERSVRHSLSPLRPGPRQLKTVLLSRFDEVGRAHARLSIAGSKAVVGKADAVLDVCGRLGRLVDVKPEAEDWNATLTELSASTLALKNELRAEAKLPALAPTERTDSAGLD